MERAGGGARNGGGVMLGLASSTNVFFVMVIMCSLALVRISLKCCIVWMCSCSWLMITVKTVLVESPSTHCMVIVVCMIHSDDSLVKYSRDTHNAVGYNSRQYLTDRKLSQIFLHIHYKVQRPS